MQRDNEERAAATIRYREQYVVEAMTSQAQAWEDASRLRRYATAIRQSAMGLEDGLREDALAWAERIETQADLLDPLPAAAPVVPDPSFSDLSPFLKPGQSGAR